MTPLGQEIQRLLDLNETNVNRLSMRDPRLIRSTLYSLLTRRQMLKPPPDELIQALAEHLRGTSVRSLRQKVAESIQLVEPEPEALRDELRGLTRQQIQALRQVALAMRCPPTTDEAIHRMARRGSAKRASDAEQTTP